MTALVTADWHLSSNPRDIYRHEFVAVTLLDMAQRHKPDQLIVLGDLTDQKDLHNAVLVNELASYIYRLSKECRVIILRGNHDCINPDNPFFLFLRYTPNVDFIVDSKVEDIEGLGLCVFLAHTRNYKKDWSRFNFDPFKRDPNAGFIFCHNTFEGADTGTGHPLRGIPTHTLPKKACVISGDVHLPQEVDQVTYVGAPYTVTFGDSYKPRVLMIGRTPKNQIQTQSIPVPGIKKLTVDIRDPHDLPNLKINDGDMVKARVHLAPDDYSRWSSIVASVRAWIEKAGGEACHIQPLKPVKGVKQLRKRQPTRTDKELMTVYGKRRSVPDDVLKTGLWLMDKV